MITPPFRKLLVANRGEIAIRVLRAATELGIPTVAVYSTEDRFALHCFKADEIYRIGKGERLIDAYLDIDAIIAVAQRADADAIHPGYGFLSENPAFANACTVNGITFVAPSSNSMRLLGNKVAARGRGTGHARYRRPSRRSGRNGAADRRRRLSADAEGKLGGSVAKFDGERRAGKLPPCLPTTCRPRRPSSSTCSERPPDGVDTAAHRIGNQTLQLNPMSCPA